MNLDGADWLPLVGSVEVIVRDWRPVSIHGDRYLDLLVSPDDRPPIPLRVPATACATSPTTGARVRLTLLMRQVERVELLA